MPEPGQAAPATLAALALAKEGRVIDLSSGWWRRMPGAAPHPQLEVVTYRTPRGQRIGGDIEMLRPEANEARVGFMSELVIGTTHSGTHIDAHCHIACGERDAWHGGYSADEWLGDFGALRDDASTLDPIIARGVLLDAAALHGVDALPAGHPIDAAQLQACARRQGVEVRAGDVVLTRTGLMRHWPDESAMDACFGSGVTLEGARWLSERQVRAVGADNVAFEADPSGVPGNPLPVHVHLLRDHGIPIMEWVLLEELAAVADRPFLFIALPLTIEGASGSMIRPLAIV